MKILPLQFLKISEISKKLCDSRLTIFLLQSTRDSNKYLCLPLHLDGLLCAWVPVGIESFFYYIETREKSAVDF